MKNKTLLIIRIFMMILLALPLIQAESIGVFKQNSCVLIFNTCTDCTYMNISSVINPDSLKVIEEVTMTKTGTFYNYSFCNTSILGPYNVNGHGDESGTDTVWAYDFTITPLGTDLSTGESIIYLIFSIASSGVFLLCLYYAVKIPWKHQRDEQGFIIGINDLRYLKLFLICISYIILMFIAGMLRGITAYYIPEIGVYGFFEVMYMIMLALIYPIIVCALLFMGIIYITNKKMEKKLIRGIDIE
jgi:hypothetical protein